MRPPAGSRPEIPLALRVAWLALAGLALVTFGFVALSRMDYPYELEFMTGACLDHVDRILGGESVYVAPTADFVTWLYGPLYFYASAAASALAGESSLAVLRAVSFGSAAVSTMLVTLIVRHATRDWLAALAAAGLWASTYGIVGTWWDIGRVDSMFVAWTAATLAALSIGTAWPSAVCAGVLMTLAYMTKQTALVIAPAFAVGLAFVSQRRAATFFATFALTLLPSIWLLDRASDGWFQFYTWSTPSSHGYELATWWSYFPGDTLAIAPMVLAAAWYVVRLLTTHRTRQAMFVSAWCSGLWLATNLSRAHIGGAENVVIPTHLGFSIVAGLAIAESAHNRGWRIAIPALLLAQFALSAYDPWHYLPTEADRQVGDRLIRILEASSGPVMLPHHGHYARRTGHAPAAHVLAVMDIERGPDHELGQRLRAEFLALSWTRNCDIVVLDEPTDAAFLPLLVRDPAVLEWDLELLFEEELGADGSPALQANGRPLFMPVVGLQARPRQVYRRKR